MEQRRKVEVLAPAGGREALTAAVFAGADAVYLGGSLFSARANAANFTREELREAVSFARERGVKVHVTVNTLLRDDELPEALDSCAYLASLPVDAVLVQDMGLFSLLRKAAPSLPLHGSTQMSVHAPAGARFLSLLGAKRVVLARELSLAEIREISEKSEIELETFAHGALCMCLSGQCYLSAVLGGRSGSRGRCAQSCRLPFSAPGGTGHDLSLKDLSFSEHLDELAAAGVRSAKIEGRMKRPEYVAAATACCRAAADGAPIPAELLADLKAVFSRSGFTDGYLRGKRGREMFGTRTKEDALDASGAVFRRLHALYRGERQRVAVEMRFSGETGKRPALRVSDGTHTVSVLGDAPLERAERTSASPERIEEQLRKTGGTPYFAEKIAVETDGLCAVPAAVLNGLRRGALEALGEKRRTAEPVPFAAPALDFPPHRTEKYALRARFQSADQLPQISALRGLERVYLPLETDRRILEGLRDAGIPAALDLPRAFWGGEDAVRRRMQAWMDAGFDRFRCGGLDGLALCRELGARVSGGFTLNAMNTAALDFFGDAGLEDAELSAELSGVQIAALAGTLPRGALVYGRLPVMLTRNCPLANAPGGCRRCKTPGSLTDRLGVRFPVRCTRQEGRFLYAELFNSVPVDLLDLDVKNIDFGLLYFTVENAVEIARVLECAENRRAAARNRTRGLFAHGVL